MLLEPLMMRHLRDVLPLLNVSDYEVTFHPWRIEPCLVAMASVLYRSMVGKQDRGISINSQGRPLIHIVSSPIHQPDDLSICWIFRPSLFVKILNYLRVLYIFGWASHPQNHAQHACRPRVLAGTRQVISSMD
jgi:hypothetical protein